MEVQEKKVIAEIKKMAQQNQMDSVKVMAKDLVRTRRYIKKFIMMKANIQVYKIENWFIFYFIGSIVKSSNLKKSGCYGSG